MGGIGTEFKRGAMVLCGVPTFGRFCVTLAIAREPDSSLDFERRPRVKDISKVQHSAMPQLKGFDTWITIENKKADEYNIDVSDDGKRVTCWIVSEVGKASLP
jgi:uncharacterized protein YqhQ